METKKKRGKTKDNVPPVNLPIYCLTCYLNCLEMKNAIFWSKKKIKGKSMVFQSCENESYYTLHIASPFSFFKVILLSKAQQPN